MGRYERIHRYCEARQRRARGKWRQVWLHLSWRAYLLSMSDRED